MKPSQAARERHRQLTRPGLLDVEEAPARRPRPRPRQSANTASPERPSSSQARLADRAPREPHHSIASGTSSRMPALRVADAPIAHRPPRPRHRRERRRTRPPPAAEEALRSTARRRRGPPGTRRGVAARPAPRAARTRAPRAGPQQRERSQERGQEIRTRGQERRLRASERRAERPDQQRIEREERRPSGTDSP